MSTPIVDPIATRAFVLTKSDGTRLAVNLVVGRPYVVDDVEARCAVHIDGLDEKYVHISGADTFQALCLAVRFLKLQVDDLVENGGRFTDSDDDAVAYDSQELGAVFGVPPEYTHPPDSVKR